MDYVLQGSDALPIGGGEIPLSFRTQSGCRFAEAPIEVFFVSRALLLYSSRSPLLLLLRLNYGRRPQFTLLVTDFRMPT